MKGLKQQFQRQSSRGVEVLPERNQKDMVEIPEEIQQDLEFIFVRDIDELLPLVLEGWSGGGSKKTKGNGGSKTPKKRRPARKRNPPSEAPPPA